MYKVPDILDVIYIYEEESIVYRANFRFYLNKEDIVRGIYQYSIDLNGCMGKYVSVYKEQREGYRLDNKDIFNILNELESLTNDYLPIIQERKKKLEELEKEKEEKHNEDKHNFCRMFE